ncbi:MAG: TniQ family protein [Crocosphaera sp.]|nr:TniQ family protein [Crocosphaera sp.]
MNVDVTQIQPYPNDELWSPERFSLPPRSCLHHLEPIGIGTSMVESLSSYVTRLAHSHGVFAGILLEKKLKPLINKRYGVATLNKIAHYSKALNGMGIMAEDLVRGLSILTSRQDLSLLTLLHWSNLFPTRQLLRSSRAWCPLCYSEQFQNNKICYEPLLWSLKIVQVCPKHHIFLVSSCPDCGQKNLPLTGRSQPGCCSKCGAWLGNYDEIHRISHPSYLSDLEWELWKGINVGNLLQKSSSRLSFPKQEAIAEALNICVSHFSQGNIALWARQLQVPRNTLWLWCKGKNLPTLQALLKICYCLRISVWDFVHHNLDLSNSTFVPPKLDLKVRSPSQQVNKSSLEMSLKLLLKENREPPMSMEEVARQLGYDRRTIFRHCPELCRLVSAKYIKYQKRTHIQKLDDCCAEVRQAVFDLHTQGKYPSEAKVAQLISRPSFFRYKRVRKALQEARQSL